MQRSLAGLLWIASACAAHATNLYVINNPHLDQNIVAAALNNPNIAGAEIILDWNTLEPGPNNFAWQALDSAIALARPGQTLSLAIVTGSYAPSWLATPPYNVPFLTFAFGPRAGRTRGCVAISMPVPYARAYVSQYNAFMDAMAAHVAATGALASVAIVKTTGIDTITEENHLPSVGCTSTTPSDPQQTAAQVAAEWQSASYTSASVERAWKQMTAEIAHDFPNALLSFEIYASENSSFPPIDQHGNIVKPALAPAILQRLIDYGIATYPLRFSAQWDGVTDIRPIPAAIVERLCAVPRAVVGWQSNEFFNVQGAGCGGSQPQDATLCTDTTYLHLLNNAKHSCGTTMEVWPVDVVNHPASFTAFSAE